MNRILKFIFTSITLSTLLVSSALAYDEPSHVDSADEFIDSPEDFVKERSVQQTINMADYYPSTFGVEHFRRANETLFSKVVTKSVDTILAYHGKQKAGGINFTQEYYYTKESSIDAPTCFRTARSFRKDTDGAVYELGGSPRNFDLPCIDSWVAGEVVTYCKGGPTGLPWGRPGLNAVSDPYFGIFNMHVKHAKKRGESLNDLGFTFATHHLDKVHEKYTPAYGRDNNGVWRKGGARTYQNVAEVTFIHGTNFSGSNTACNNRPDLHVKGYHSIFIKQFMVKGIGIQGNRV
jgi:hypothetical protein